MGTTCYSEPRVQGESGTLRRVVHNGEGNDLRSPISLLLQGEWKPRQIDNPEYKGVWIHPEIDNPEYSPDSNIYAYENFAVLGLDLWQVRHGGKRRLPRGPQVLRVNPGEKGTRAGRLQNGAPPPFF